VDRRILEQAGELTSRGEPFALATVVWRRSPSSGKEGSTALIQADGKVRGWLGGACAEPTVVREARRAIEEGTPRLLFLGSPDELPERAREGVVTVPIACQSEGALEVYVEPVLPRPHLVVVGRSPAVDTLVALASDLGWDTVLVDEGGSEADHPGAGRVMTRLDLPAAGVTARSFVVVATQGHYDEEALEQAVRTPAAYVGLVASRRRAQALLGYLGDRGWGQEALDRVHAPAGLDLGAVSHEEIAVAVLAEMVRDKAGGAGRGFELATAALSAVDPVCGMAVDRADARNRASHKGQEFLFCSASCRRRFEAEPAAFAGVSQ